MYTCCAIIDSWVLADADPASFQVISGAPYDYFVKDKYHVWWNEGLLPNADPSTFIVVLDPYAKDSRHVYYGDQLLIPEADPESFSFYPSGIYVHDNTHVYCVGLSVPGANSSSFIDLGNGYGKDQQHVWYDGDVVTGHGGQDFGALGGLDLVAAAVGPKEKNQTDRHQNHKSQNQDFARAFKPA